MRCDPTRPGRRWIAAAAGAWAMAAAFPAWSQSAATPQIYSCIDASGKKITSDRPIIECNSTPQRVLNPDGSIHSVKPPTPTAEEEAANELQEHEAAIQRAKVREAIRRDQNLLARFPDEAHHKQAREAALADVRAAIKVSEQRLAHLAKERKPLKDESEFYVGKPLPIKLKTQIDANEAESQAQRDLLQNQQQEVTRN